jgi:hypothetical protein
MPNHHRVPLFKSWNGWYAALIAVLLLLIVFFSWFTKYFS